MTAVEFARESPARSLTAILVCGSVIVMIAMGVRHGLGLFLGPMSTDLGWNREVFSLAIALQNLFWGAAQPLAGGLADRYGAPRVIVGGALMYAAGLALMTVSAVPIAFSLTAGVLIGLALSGVTYSVIYGVVGRSFPEHKRSQAMGYIAAAGSFGQFLTVPLEQWLIGGMGWSKRAARAGLDCAGHGADGAGFARTEARARGRHPNHPRGAQRSVPQRQFLAVDRRLFRVRLPGGVHRDPPARLSQGLRPRAERRRNRTRADRALQYHRHLGCGLSWRAPARNIC